jgi:hypothetical protein
MATESDESTIAARRKRASAISGGIFLIGLGVLLITNWWWPGIMIVIGLSSGGELIFRGQTRKGIGTMAFFFAIPVVVWLVSEVDIPWGVVGAMLLIGLGVITIVRVFYLREE